MNHRDPALLKLCRGQTCYLQVPGVCVGGTETTVPCHSNQQRDGKGMGIKAHDVMACPGCGPCHAYIDHKRQAGSDEAFRIWDDGWRRWIVDLFLAGLVTVAVAQKKPRVTDCLPRHLPRRFA